VFVLKDKEKDCQTEETTPVEETTSCECETEVDALGELQKAFDEQKDLLLRTAAEYDNFKKRTQREKEELSNFTKCSVLKDLLPALDNFDRSKAAGIDNPEEYKKGMDMSIKSLLDALEKLGLKEIESEGKEFDPNFHYAISKIEDENLGENIIAQVYQKGYAVGDTVIRPAMVVVANCN
jgi:molecular chaperone GrpE